MAILREIPVWTRFRSLGEHAVRMVVILCALSAVVVNAAPDPNTQDGTRTLAGVDLNAVVEQKVASALPPGWQNGAFMEVFVRGYKDSNGDGVGDIWGLIQQLDYLRDLGVKGIWLMPITASADGDHGYATTDYRALDPAYGTLDDFDELLRQAHSRGIGVIMDYVINHSARSHPLFVSSSGAPESPYRDWYVWESEAPKGWDIWGKNPWTAMAQGSYFATFGPHMPDFNFKNPAVLAYHQDSLRFWLNRGLDGFRLDAAPHLVENSASEWNDQAQSRQISSELRSLITSYPQRHLVCEATANPQVYAAAGVCGSAFAFGLERNLVKAAKGDRQSIVAVADYFTTAPHMASFVSNHDLFAGARLWDQLNGNLAQYKLAAASYLLMPGTPFIYYGEEIGMAGVKGLAGDSSLRTPMSWTSNRQGAGFTTGTPFRPLSPNRARFNAAAQVSDPGSLLSFYKSMLTLRNTRASLSQGNFAAPFVKGKVMGFERNLGNESTLVLINYGAKARTVRIPGGPARSAWVQLYPRTKASIARKQAHKVRLRLEAQSVRIFDLQPQQ